MNYLIREQVRHLQIQSKKGFFTIAFTAAICHNPKEFLPDPAEVVVLSILTSQKIVNLKADFHLSLKFE